MNQPLQKSYRAFNLHFSADINIPEFQAETKEKSDVVICASIIPGEVQPSSQQLLLDINPIARFLIKNGDTIHYQCYSGAHADELHLFLLGSCMGAFLQQRGLIVLHGTAISLDGETCTLFVGHSGAGKSTLAASYAKKKLPDSCGRCVRYFF